MFKIKQHPAVLKFLCSNYFEERSEKKAKGQKQNKTKQKTPQKQKQNKTTKTPEINKKEGRMCAELDC